MGKTGGKTEKLSIVDILWRSIWGNKSVNNIQTDTKRTKETNKMQKKSQTLQYFKKQVKRIKGILSDSK